MHTPINYSSDCALGVDVVEGNQTIAVYPNPTSNFITIDTPMDIDYIELYDLTGRKLNTFYTGFEKLPLDCAKGTYLLKMYASVLETKKVVVR
ncbi:T9SS type A sorting domain-containing protein [Neptunitalea chrysea]|uniref:T9SS type A sorting domain-containing protein n=1 Tax=Neptunitalea chrysea TaxID=1647581 RepID=UPI0024932F81|nr:T9SS type A sorting domain-containing protein [Neptunitalea chrysea]